MNIFQKVSVVVGLALYVPLTLQILRKHISQNLATWILWGSLDAFAGAALFIAGGSFHLPTAYVFGCICVIGAILKSANYRWTSLENGVSIIVGLCLVVWSVVVWGFSNPWLATILSTAGVALGTIPQFRDTWTRPQDSPLFIFVGYTFVNVLSTIGGGAWTVEERLYPAVCSVLTIALVVMSTRKPQQ